MLYYTVVRCIMLYYTVHYFTMPHHAMLYNTCHTILYYIMLYFSTLPCSTVLDDATLYCITLGYSILYPIILTVRYYTFCYLL